MLNGVLEYVKAKPVKLNPEDIRNYLQKLLKQYSECLSLNYIDGVIL